MNDYKHAARTPHDEWTERIAVLAPKVREWGERIKTPKSPSPGSSLANDRMEKLDVESVIWYALCVSVEHLNLTIDVMHEIGKLYPTAYMTVLRTSFLTSVNALWVLSGKSRVDRRLRALRITADDVNVQIKVIRASPATEDTESAKELSLQRLLDRQDELQAIANELGSTENVRRMRLNQTDIVSDVAEQWNDSEAGEYLGDGFPHIWRTGSAAAHGQYHFGASRVSPEDLMGSEGTSAVARLKGDLANDVGPALAAVFFVLLKAFQIYDSASLLN